MIDARRHRLGHLDLDTEHQADWADLLGSINGSTPCRDQPWWTSEDPDMQSLAARACQRCPVIQECRAYGLAYPGERGVYGGLTEDARRPRRNRQRKEAS